MDQVFDLFDNLGATDEQLDFPIVYTSAMNGIAGLEPDALAENMQPLFETIVNVVEPPHVDTEARSKCKFLALIMTILKV